MLLVLPKISFLEMHPVRNAALSAIEPMKRMAKNVETLPLPVLEFMSVFMVLFPSFYGFVDGLRCSWIKSEQVLHER